MVNFGGSLAGVAGTWSLPRSVAGMEHAVAEEEIALETSKTKDL